MEVYESFRAEFKQVFGTGMANAVDFDKVDVKQLRAFYEKHYLIASTQWSKQVREFFLSDNGSKFLPAAAFVVFINPYVVYCEKKGISWY